MVTALDGPEAHGYEWDQVQPIPKGSVEDWAASSCAEGVWPWWLGSCGSAGLQRTSTMDDAIWLYHSPTLLGPASRVLFPNKVCLWDHRAMQGGGVNEAKMHAA